MRSEPCVSTCCISEPWDERVCLHAYLAAWQSEDGENSRATREQLLVRVSSAAVGIFDCPLLCSLSVVCCVGSNEWCNSGWQAWSLGGNLTYWVLAPQDQMLIHQDSVCSAHLSLATLSRPKLVFEINLLPPTSQSNLPLHVDVYLLPTLLSLYGTSW